jgi:hypothetical protein
VGYLCPSPFAGERLRPESVDSRSAASKTCCKFTLRKNMADPVISNQNIILSNQATLLANQKTILDNQDAIKKNQNALNSILKNQELILKNQKEILAALKK